MATKSIWSRTGDISKMDKTPQLIVSRDMNDYPATARCSSCGEQMPERQRWINSSAENLAWFVDQFALHVEQVHPSWTANSGGLKAA
jgi:hypothetical protein